MDTKDRRALASAFTGGFFAIGISYWRIPYAELSLPNAIFGLGLFAVCVLAALSRVLSSARFWPTTLVVGASVPAAVIARVIYLVRLLVASLHSAVAPNNSFKPTPYRGIGRVLYATLAHVRRPARGRLNSGVRAQWQL